MPVEQVTLSAVTAPDRWTNYDHDLQERAAGYVGAQSSPLLDCWNWLDVPRERLAASTVVCRRPIGVDVDYFDRPVNDFMNSGSTAIPDVNLKCVCSRWCSANAV